MQDEAGENVQGGRQKTRKKQLELRAKLKIFIKITAQSMIYLIYYYENTNSGDIEDKLLPLICFFIGVAINMSLVYYSHSQTLFILLHILLTIISFLLAKELDSVSYDSNQLHIKLFLVLTYFSCMLVGRLDYKNYKQAAVMYALIFAIICTFQGLLYSSYIDTIFIGLFFLYSSYTSWNYQRLLDQIGNYQASLCNKQYKEELQLEQQKLSIQKLALGEGISDCIFFTQLDIESLQVKLKFFQVNKTFRNNFNTFQVGLENILAKMKVAKKEDILKIQKKIYKILFDDSTSAFEDLLNKILSLNYAQHPQQGNLGSVAHLNQQDQQQAFGQQQPGQQQAGYGNNNEEEEMNEQYNNGQQYNQRKRRFIYDNNNNMRQKKNGLEQKFWQIDQLIICIKKIHQEKKRDPHFNITSVSNHKFVDYFNMQEILLLYLFALLMKNNKTEDSIEKNNYFRRKMQDVEVLHENTLFSVQLFNCKYSSQKSLFFSMQKKQSFNQSDTTNNSNTDEATQRLFQFFKNRTQKISKSITSSLCRFDCIRNFSQTETQMEKSYAINCLTYQLEYLRITLKDTEEYREFLQEQQRSYGRDYEIKIQQKQITQFKFKQLFDDIKHIFAAEVSFKSTSITLEEKYKKKGKELYKQAQQPQDQQQSCSLPQKMQEMNKLNQCDDSIFLYTDYDKLKRILILLIENSLSYQKAGTIEIEVKEENQNALCIMIIDNQNIINNNEIRAINEKGYSDKGFGFAIVSELLKAIKPKSIINPLKIQKDEYNDKTKIVFWIAKSIFEEYQNQTITNLSHMNGTNQDVLQDQRDRKYADASNGSHNEKIINDMIMQNEIQLNDGSQNHQRNHSQASHLYSPSKKTKSISDFQIQLRDNLLLYPTPLHFLNFYQRKKNAAEQYIGSNTNIGVGFNNNFLTINNPPPQRSNSNPQNTQNNQNIQNSNNNQGQLNIFTPYMNIIGNDKSQPSFLIVSCDFRISSSLNQLLTYMCGSKKESVKYASNKDNFKQLLTHYIFEFIMIDQLEGINMIDIVKEINSKYRNKKQNQKIIFFDYNGNIKRNLENQIPLIIQQDQNFNESKSEFKLLPPDLPYFHNHIYQQAGHQNQQNGYANQNATNEEFTRRQSQQNVFDKQEEIHANYQINRHSSQHDSQESISIPSEPQNQNKHQTYSPNKISPLEIEIDANTARSMKQIQDPDQSNHQLSNFNLIGHLNQTNQFRNTSLNQIQQTNGVNQKKTTSNQSRVAFLGDETMNEGHINNQINLREDEVKVKKLFPSLFQLSQAPHPRAQVLDSDHNSINSSTNKNKVGSLNPDEALNINNNFFNRSITVSNKNSPTNPPKTNPNYGAKSLKKSSYMNSNKNQNPYNKQLFSGMDDKWQESQQKQNEQTFILNNQQDNFQGSFPHKYNESIEVAQSLKFFYYTLQYPFGYTQIYEAICHMNFIKDIVNQNINFFNLNTPELYYQ